MKLYEKSFEMISKCLQNYMQIPNNVNQISKVITKEKIIDDQTPEVAQIFELWKKRNKNKFEDFDF